MAGGGHVTTVCSPRQRGCDHRMRHFLAFSYNLHDSSVSIADEERVLLVLEAERYFGEEEALRPRRDGDAGRRRPAPLRHRHPAGRGRGLHVLSQRAPARGQPRLQVDRRAAHRRGRRLFDALVLNHHLAHAAIVYAYPGIRDVVMDVCDGGGDFGDSHFTYRYRDGRIEQLANRPVHDAFSARFYDVMSRYLYKRRLCEGKMMALASLGQPRADMMTFIRDHLAMFDNAPPDETCAEIAPLPGPQLHGQQERLRPGRVGPARVRGPARAERARAAAGGAPGAAGGRRHPQHRGQHEGQGGPRRRARAAGAAGERRQRAVARRAALLLPRAP